MKTAMTLRVVERTADRFVLAVGHADWQSYSRAVDPRAMRAARATLRDGRQWALIDADYDSVPCVDRRTESIYTFVPREAVK